MDGVEAVENVLNCFVVRPLSAVIEPDRNKGQYGKSLLGYFQGSSKNRNKIYQPAHHLPVDVYHAYKLANPAEGHIAEQVEYKHHQDTVAKVVYHGNKTNQKTKYYRYKNPQGKTPF